MANQKKSGGSSSKGSQPGRWRARRKVCGFCVDKVDYIDYKNANKLRKYMTERCKIIPRRTTGTCAAHQRALAVAIKRAREMALIGFVAE
jgi:small subunit ribosomal protein S18